MREAKSSKQLRKGINRLECVTGPTTELAFASKSFGLETSVLGGGGIPPTPCRFRKPTLWMAPSGLYVLQSFQTFVLISAGHFATRPGDSPLAMRMNLRTEECRRRAAECARKALCAPDEEVRRTFAELAEQWRMLAEHAEYLGRYN